MTWLLTRTEIKKAVLRSEPQQCTGQCIHLRESSQQQGRECHQDEPPIFGAKRYDVPKGCGVPAVFFCRSAPLAPRALLFFRGLKIAACTTAIQEPVLPARRRETCINLIFIDSIR